MMVIRNGYIVYKNSYENDYVKINEGKDPTPHLFNYTYPGYHPFYQGTKLHTLQSVTKSFASTLIGIAIDQGKIPDVNVKVLDYFKGQEIKHADEWKQSMTLENILTMKAGFWWDESIPIEDPRNPTMHMEYSDDWVDYVINLPMDKEPGTLFLYNNGASHLLSYILKEATGMYMDEFAEEYLFGPLGVTDYYWKKTPRGLPDSEGGLYLVPQDLAKLGYLYLHKGKWEDRQIVSETWIEETVKSRGPISWPDDKEWKRAYGYQWWLLPYNDSSDKYAYGCLGYGGQYLLTVPEYNLIAVFTGWNIYEKTTISLKDLLATVLKAIDKG
jgi:CubicO group peptidase (beta-lactamase class C family)